MFQPADIFKSAEKINTKQKKFLFKLSCFFFLFILFYYYGNQENRQWKTVEERLNLYDKNIYSLHSRHTDTVQTFGCWCSVCGPRKLHHSGSQNVILSPGPNLTFFPTAKGPDLPGGAQDQGVMSERQTMQIIT